MDVGKQPDTLVEKAAEFLCGRGRNFTRSALRQNGLRDDLFDDLTQEVLIRAHRAELRSDEIANVEAFTATLVTRAARDMIRGHLRRPEGAFQIDPLESADGAPDLQPGFDDPMAALIGREHADQLRRLLAPGLAQHPVAAAGALAVVAIAVDEAVPADDVPTPKGGVDGNEAIAWAGLFYAGGRDCFPSTGSPENPAMRKRRSRALERQRSVLRAATSELVDMGGNDG